MADPPAPGGRGERLTRTGESDPGPRHVDDAEIERLRTYCEQVVRLLRLDGYELALAEFPPENPQALAEVHLTDGRRFARLAVAVDWADYSPDRRRYSIVHEVLHVLHSRLGFLLQADLQPVLGAPAHAVFWPVVNRELEHLVDALADALAPLLPAYPEAEEG